MANLDDVNLVRLCSVCRTELGKLVVKKENMMLTPSKEMVWCETCKAMRREIREFEGRLETVLHERSTYPRSGLEVGLEDPPPSIIGK